MKICVAGLGLIGGSMCMALRRAGREVFGWNRSHGATEYALANGIISGEALSFEEFDAVFVALPPRAAADFICGTSFGDGAVVSDICGVKAELEREVLSRPRNFRYVGCHPMAGKEVSGLQNACADLFDNASMVITHSAYTDGGAVEIIKSLTRDMGFKRIVECTAEVHDRKIAYTSQLAHVVSNAYVKDAELDGCIGFTGGSFQDMTRIAGVDEGVWAALYLCNARNLSQKIASLVESLNRIKEAVESGDAQKLRLILREGRELFEARREELSKNPDISVKNLK